MRRIQFGDRLAGIESRMLYLNHFLIMYVLFCWCYDLCSSECHGLVCDCGISWLISLVFHVSQIITNHMCFDYVGKKN